MGTKQGLKASRRDFLKAAWGLMGGVVALEFAGITIAYLQPRLGEGEFGGIIRAGKVDDFPSGSVTHIAQRAILPGAPAGWRFPRVYQRCTHLGCNVPWDQTEGLFVCPCHSSQFDLQGGVLNPPAPTSIGFVSVLFVDGAVQVDTAKPNHASEL